jgi:integrase
MTKIETMTRPDDFEEILRADIDAVLQELVARHRELDAMGQLPLPADVQALVTEHRTTISVRIAALVTRWVTAGGRIVLEAPVVPELPRPVPLPTVMASDPVAVQEPAVTPEAIVPEPRRKPVPLTREQLEQSLKAPREQPAERSTSQVSIDVDAEGMRAAEAILDGIGPVDAEPDVVFDRIRKALWEIDAWERLPQGLQRMLIAMAVTRLRYLQAQCAMDTDAVIGLLRRITGYSARVRPGAVYGLAKDHTPRRASWREDAEAATDQLRNFLGVSDEDLASPESAESILRRIERLHGEVANAPAAARQAVISQLVREIRGAIKEGVPARHSRLVRLAADHVDQLTFPDLRNLRRAVREHLDAQAEENGGVVNVRVPPEWGWSHHTRDRVVLIIGGEPREPARARIEAAFGMRRLDWLPADDLAMAKARVIGGKYDLVLLLRDFIGHSADEVVLEAARKHGVSWAHVEHGYGVVRIRSSIERYLEPN